MNKTPVSPLTLWHVVSVRVAYGSFLFATHSSTLSITRPICYHNRNHSWLRKQHLWHLSKPPIHQKNLSNNIWHGKWKFSLNNAKKNSGKPHTHSDILQVYTWHTGVFCLQWMSFSAVDTSLMIHSSLFAIILNLWRRLLIVLVLNCLSKPSITCNVSWTMAALRSIEETSWEI